MRYLLSVFIMLPPIASIASISGNLNLSYQGIDLPQAPRQSTSGQVLNIYIRDRIFYANDLLLGAILSRNAVSTADRADTRIRYSLNMTGYRYIFYSSFSPYTLYRDDGVSEKIRAFQSTINYRPKLLPDISSSYTSNRQYSTESSRSTDNFNYTWNVSTQLSKKFGNFKTAYQRQESKTKVDVSRKQVQQTWNFAYDISKLTAWRLAWSASYSLGANHRVDPDAIKDDNLSHNGALHVSRGFGRWLTLAAASTGSVSRFERLAESRRFQDISTNASANVKLRENISVMILRGYSSNKHMNHSTSESVSDYVSISNSIEFGILGENRGRLSTSRSIFFRSALGPTTTDKGTVAFDIAVYRQTAATLNFGLSHNNKTYSGHDRFQMTRSLDITSRPMPRTSLDINFQSSLAADRVSFLRSTNESFSINLAQILKPEFNYTVGYRRYTVRSGRKNVISSIGTAVNYVVLSNVSLTATYSRRDLGNTIIAGTDRIDNSSDGSLAWNFSARSAITLNYSVLGIHSTRQSETFGGYFITSF